jgi:tight adherence protein B
MLAALVVFIFVTSAIVGLYLGSRAMAAWSSSRRVELRLREVSVAGPVDDVEAGSSVVMRTPGGPLPIVERIMAHTQLGSRMARLIEQSGVATTSGAIVGASLTAGIVAGLLSLLIARSFLVALGVGLAAAASPFLWLLHKRSKRLKKFEEQFPEALDLLSRALRAGHAFQAAMGMVAEELPAPVGVEFKKAFEQQNFGLPLREALNELSGRVPSMDVRFFVTSVTIQRETGGNLSEILDNLSRVVRERFKIRRQVRVHTAHGRFTGYVLLALPAALAMALMWMNPQHMKLLFDEPLGQTMLVIAMVMQTVGFVWIRQIIKIEV